jgi:16S rRNA (cytosine967-C5)-methyltransferase
VHKAITPRDLALQVLMKLGRGSGQPENYLEDSTGGSARISERDRAFAVHLVQGVLRWRLRLDWIVQQALRFPFKNIRPDVLYILRLAVYQIFFLDRVPDSAAVNEAIKQVKRTAAAHVVRSANGILRQICRDKDHLSHPPSSSDRIASLSLHHSYPEWLVRKWVREMGPCETERLLSAGNRIPPLVIRTNTLKIDRPGLARALQKEGISAAPTTFSPEGLIVSGVKGPIDRLTSFRSGLFQVQGDAAQVCSHLLSPKPGEIILDVCSGLGGKSTHLAELMGDKGLIVGIDRSRRKLLKLTENRKRLGIRGVVPLAGDVEKDLSKLLKCSFDKIMVDGPCSALGVISRHPDVKWNRNAEDPLRFGKVQGRVLHNVLPLLRRGGKMLYVTCTLSQQENEGVVEAFLRKNREIRLRDLRKDGPAWAGDLVDEAGFMKSLPQVHGTDGFFAALFEKEV